MESVPGRTIPAGPALRARKKEVGEGGTGWGMMPRERGAGERERVNVRRLRVLVRPFTLEPSELEARGEGLGTRGDLTFISPPPLRVSALIEPRLSITVRASSSVSSSSVLILDAELEIYYQHLMLSIPLSPLPTVCKTKNTQNATEIYTAPYGNVIPTDVSAL
jgi:hypothetical protein